MKVIPNDVLFCFYCTTEVPQVLCLQMKKGSHLFSFVCGESQFDFQYFMESLESQMGGSLFRFLLSFCLSFLFF